MLIVLMAWLYVIGVYAIAQDSLASAVSILLFLGVLPVLLLAWLLRRRRRLQVLLAQSRDGS